MRIRTAFAAAALLALAACSRETASTVETPRPTIQASFQEVMLSVVDPAADALWNSVRISYDLEGEHREVPTTDEDWLALRRHAITLIESPNLVAMDGRVLLKPGAAIEFGQYYPKPEEIQGRIDGNKAGFLQMAQGLQLAGLEALAAIDKKDVAALEAAGERIDAACEACHVTFWYHEGQGG